jgi:hypothetical protein
LTTFTSGKRLVKVASLSGFAGPCGDQLAAAALDRADHAVDVIVAHAADGELDVVFRRLFGGRAGPRLRSRGPAFGLRQAGHHGAIIQFAPAVGKPAIIAVPSRW